MNAVLLGYRDRNVHELVCHEVAQRAGHYAHMGVDVEAVPGSDHPEAALSVGLGGSLVEALRGQRRWKATLVHTVHPLFWIWAREAGTTNPSTLAGHPEGSIVSALTSKALNARGIDNAELSVLRFPVGSAGDHQRLEALTSGAADAAVLGATFAPAALSRLGLTRYLFFGRVLKFPTVGLAVDVDRIDVDHSAVLAVVAAHRAAIQDVKRGDPVALDAVATLLEESNRRDAARLLRDYISPHYGPARRDVRAAATDALSWLPAELRHDKPTGEDFYEEVR